MIWLIPVMPSMASPLPCDPGALKAMLIAERTRADRLEEIIKAMQRPRFGRRAETMSEDQLLLSFEGVEQTVATTECLEKAEALAIRTAATAKRRANRSALPPHLPRIEILRNIEDKSYPCCSGLLHKAGEDRSERLDIIPAQLRVGHQLAALRLPDLRGRRHPLTSTGEACRRRPAD